MCFRPASAASSRTCPECAGVVNAVGGFLPPKCPYCGHVFTAEDDATDATAPAAAIPAAPGTPAVPGAPTAPQAPTAPKAPTSTTV